MASSPEPLDGSLVSEEPSELSPLPDDDKAARKARRQTAIYPNTLRSTPKPFSRSAAKRESVMALGSIEHLQHYFTKTGIAAKQNPAGRRKGLVPAIGGARHVRAASSVTSIPELPPSPMVPASTSSRPPWVHIPKTYELDPDHLRPGVIRDLRAVEHAWRIGANPPQDDKLTPQPEPSSFDVLSTLRITTRAIRSVRDYVVSLPDDHPTHKARIPASYRSPAFSAPSPSRPVPSNPDTQSLATVMEQNLPAPPSSRPGLLPGSASPRPSLLSVSSSPRPSLSPSLSAQNTGASNASTASGGPSSLSFPVSGQAFPMSSQPFPTSTFPIFSQPFPIKQEEPVGLVRHAALDVLTALRGLEERARIPGAEPDPNTTVSQSNDGRSASSRSDTPADRVGSPGMFHSGDEAERESATSLSTFSPAARGGLPRLQIATGVTTSTMLVHGRGAVQVWSESDEEELMEDEPEKREVWDERLVLGGGWLYRSDMGCDDVLDEVAVVKRYLDIVDMVLFNGPARVGKRGWERERKKGRKSETPTNVMSDSEEEGGLGANRRVSSALSEAMRYLSTVEDQTVVEEDEEDVASGESEELPLWATTEPFGSDLIARTNALLRCFLPPSLVPLLPTCPTRDSLLLCLSDGQMLCAAYNSAVRRSKKAWGFINSQSIHNTAAATSEEKTAGSFTFRRKENLGLWAAALKLRYVIDIVPAGPKASSKTRHFHQAPAPETEVVASNQFSPIVIAKHESGWEDMLERAIWEWVNAVVTETRETAAVA